MKLKRTEDWRLESGRLVTLRKGLKVTPATNLPKDSKYKYFLSEVPREYRKDEEFKSFFNNIGFGFEEHEVCE
jgi:hypothetical protein